MIEFEKPNITKIDENKDYGKFVIEPLERCLLYTSIDLSPRENWPFWPDNLTGENKHVTYW